MKEDLQRAGVTEEEARDGVRWSLMRHLREKEEDCSTFYR